MPDHELEGADYVTINSHRAAKDTAPATQDLAVDYNSVWRGLMRLVLDSGVGLAASAAVAQAEDWVRLLQSVRRLGRQALPTVHTMTSGTSSLTPSLDVHGYTIEENAGYADGTLTLGQAAHSGRLLAFYNNTASTKILRNTDTSVITRMLTDTVVLLWCQNIGGTMYWFTLGEVDETIITVSCKLARAGSLDDSNNRNFEFRIDERNKKTLLQPTTATIFTINLASAVALVYLGPADDSTFAVGQVAKTDNILVGMGYAADGAGLAEIVGIWSRTSGVFEIRRFNASNFPTGTSIGIEIPPLTFINLS